MRPPLSCFLLLFLCPCLWANDALDLARAFFGPPEKLQSVNSIYYEGKMVNFPLEFSNIFQMFDYSQILKIFMENLYYRMKVNKTPRNFKELAYQNYGKTLSNLFLINYTEKLWGDYCKNLDSTISGKRLKNKGNLGPISGMYSIFQRVLGLFS